MASLETKENVLGSTVPARGGKELATATEREARAFAALSGLSLSEYLGPEDLRGDASFPGREERQTRRILIRLKEREEGSGAITCYMQDVREGTCFCIDVWGHGEDHYGSRSYRPSAQQSREDLNIEELRMGTLLYAELKGTQHGAVFIERAAVLRGARLGERAIFGTSVKNYGPEGTWRGEQDVLDEASEDLQEQMGSVDEVPVPQEPAGSPSEEGAKEGASAEGASSEGASSRSAAGQKPSGQQRSSAPGPAAGDSPRPAAKGRREGAGRTASREKRGEGSPALAPISLPPGRPHTGFHTSAGHSIREGDHVFACRSGETPPEEKPSQAPEGAQVVRWNAARGQYRTEDDTLRRFLQQHGRQAAVASPPPSEQLER